MSKILGLVTEEESEQIKNLFNRKAALQELLQVVDLNVKPELYDHLISDVMQTNQGIGEWWHIVSEKYKWEFQADDVWQINYETFEVSLK